MANTITRPEENRISQISQEAAGPGFHTFLALFSLAMAIFTTINTGKHVEIKRR